MSVVAEEKKISPGDPPRPMLPKQLVLRCMVYPDARGGRREYTAECIDLDITVRSSTPYAALKSLKDAIDGYLNVVTKGDSAGLIPRPSPWEHRVRYHMFALRAALSIGVRNFFLTDLPSDRSFC